MGEISNFFLHYSQISIVPLILVKLATILLQSLTSLMNVAIRVISSVAKLLGCLCTEESS